MLESICIVAAGCDSNFPFFHSAVFVLHLLNSCRCCGFVFIIGNSIVLMYDNFCLCGIFGYWYPVCPSRARALPSPSACLSVLHIFLTCCIHCQCFSCSFCKCFFSFFSPPHPPPIVSSPTVNHALFHHCRLFLNSIIVASQESGKTNCK